MPTHFWWGPLGSSSCAVAISTSFSGFIVAALCRLCLYPGRCRCFFLWYPLRDNRSIPHTHCSCTEATLSRMCPDCIRISVILHIPVSNNDRIVASGFWLVGWFTVQGKQAFASAKGTLCPCALNGQSTMQLRGEGLNQVWLLGTSESRWSVNVGGCGSLHI